MSHADTGVRVAGAWLALAAIILAAALVFHGPIAPDHDTQIQRIADGSLRWSVVHWAAAAALSFFAIASLIALTAGSSLTREWWTLSAWALLPVGALWTVTTAVAEATVIHNAAVTGNRAVYESWWMFAEGNGNGFAAMALAFTVIAANEAQTEDGVTPFWVSSIAALAGLASFAGWALGMWLGQPFGSAIWVVGSIVMCLWLVWFGVSLARVEAGPASVRHDAPSGA
ncbi:hypothetical protein [Chelativorans sp. M5D2P16]|uniref:hypothetical protein n=1 Tax=Chelativorans sp. M5D2P16 TaxID=3095678 RepID=UPI002ACAE479|nr:hypothetical protein [Chelativorans sp. M5D2P16]MDZ5698735.1 hypothetical protein [Chelativorans sp. M5D2P16]